MTKINFNSNLNLNSFLITLFLWIFSTKVYAQDIIEVIYVNASKTDPLLVSTNGPNCASYDQYNAILDFWNTEERPLMEAAARKLLAKENKPSSPTHINQLQAQLRTDPIRRFQYAPYMIAEFYKALETMHPNAAQTAYQKRFNNCISCKEWLFAVELLEQWKIHTGADDARLQPAPSGGYKYPTLSIWQDVMRDRASKKGFIADEINEIYSTPKGDKQLAKLLAPTIAGTIPDFGDRVNLKALGGDMHEVLEGTIGAGVAALGLVATGSFVYRQAYVQANHTAKLNNEIKARDFEELEELKRQLGKQADDVADDAAKKVTQEITEEVVEKNAKKAAEKATKKLSAKALKNAGKKITKALGKTAKGVKAVIGKIVGKAVGKSVTMGSVAASVGIVGTLVSAGMLIGEEVADVINTQNYDNQLREAAEWKLKNTTASLNPNPPVSEDEMDGRKISVFKELLYFNVSLPAERGQLTFEYPEIPNEYGKKKGLNGVQVLDVQFYKAPDQTLEVAKQFAYSNNWRLATEAEVLRAMFYLQKSGPRGMIADGSFVMPITSTFTDSKGKTYKTGLNKNIGGTNDGFYYVKIQPTPGRKPAVQFLPNNRQPNSQIVQFQNAWLNKSIQADRNGNLLLGKTQAEDERNWRIIHVMEGRARIQHIASGKYLLAKYNSVDKKTTRLVLEPLQEPASYPIADFGAWIIERTGNTSNWYRIKTEDGLYLHAQNQNLQLSPIDPNWFSPTWAIQAPGHEQALKEALLNHSFQRNPYTNSYHGGSFTEGANGTFIWKNDEGISWATRPNFAQSILNATIGNNPYKNDHDGKAFKLKLNKGDILTGFEFKGDFYHLKKLPAKNRVVKFHSQTGLSLAQAQNIATVRRWEVATPSEIQLAWMHQKLDVYAFGMMADGRFAVPVQTDHSNFKKGANIGATGGNQGFFYTVEAEKPAPPKPTPTTTSNSNSSPTSNSNITDTSTTTTKNQLVDLNATYFITDAKHNKSLVTGNVYGSAVYHQSADFRRTDVYWYFIPTGDGYYYIYDLRFNKALVVTGYNGGSIRHQDPKGQTNAQWKITPSPIAGKYIITDRKYNKALVAGDVADNNAYHQPHNNRPNAYWSFIPSKNKAPTTKPNPNANAVTNQPTTTPKPTTTNKPQPKPTGYTWLDNDFIRIQNSSTNTHYLHIQNGKLVNGPIQANDLSAQWKFIHIGSSKNIGGLQNRSNPELYLDRINGEFIITKTSQRPAWGGLVWGLFPKNEQQHADLVRIQGTTAPYESIYIENGKVKLKYLDASEQKVKSIWWKVVSAKPSTQTSTTSTTAPPKPTPASNSMAPASPGFVRIQNYWKKSHYIHNQNGKIEDGLIQANDVSNWWSAQWKIIPVHSGWVRIQNKWKPDLYLNFSGSQLEVAKIQPNWASALWKLVPAHDGWVRIQNSWNQEFYIHNQNGKIEIGKIDTSWGSALWKVE